MSNEGTYTVFPEDGNEAGASFSLKHVEEAYRMLRDLDEPKRKKKKDKKKDKKKKKGKKDKAKKFKKNFNSFFDFDKKSKKKSKGKKSKKGKSKKSKGKKQAIFKLKVQVAKKACFEAIDTTTYGARRLIDYKLPAKEGAAEAK